MLDILECTLRDGSYVVDCQWTAAEVGNIVGELARAGFRYIEVGNGTGLGAYRTSRSLLNDEEHVRAAVARKQSARIGVFFIPGIGTKADLDRFARTGGDFVRIGTNVNESEQAFPFIEHARRLGLEVGYNFMKSYAVPHFELCVRARDIERSGAQSIAIVDSAGGMMPEEVGHYIATLKECVGARVGFHGHNNLLLANANNLAAAQAGADVIDTTLMGMGRGSGNSQTESMIVILKKHGFTIPIDPLEVSNISAKYISPRATQLKGADGLELTQGVAFFHSSYLKLVDKHATQYGVDPKQVIVEVSRVNKVDPSEQLIEDVARQLSTKKRVDIFFPKFHRRQVK
jgi:4-hydroxy 2-oxovalerate aldolase